MLKALRILILGGLGAAIVHIAIILALPNYSPQDVWSGFSARGGLYTTVALAENGPGAPVNAFDNPLFEKALCRFDLTDGMVRVTATGRVPFWSLSVYDRDGLNIFSLNDRSASDNALDVVILSPAQMLAIRKETPTELERSVLVEADIDEGMVLARAFVPDASWAPTVNAFIKSVTCTPP